MLTINIGVDYNWTIMLVKILAGTVAVFFFLFIFWKKLKEDYASDIIFQVTTWILVGMALGLTVSKIFLPTWFFWLALMGGLIEFVFMLLKFKLKFNQSLEAFILAGMPMISLMFFADSVTNFSLNSFIAFIGSLVLLFLAFWFDTHYKSFAWYKSGKIGFSGLAIGAVFFLARTVIAIFNVVMISCVGKADAIISGILVMFCIGLLIHLGREKE